MIKGVTFDWWFTIVDMPVPLNEYTPWAKDYRVRGMHEVLQQSGIEVTMDKLSLAYDQLTKHLEDVWNRNLDMYADDQIAVFLRYAGVRKTGDEDLVARLSVPFGAALIQRPPVLNDGVADCLNELKNNGFKIGIISNTGRTWGRYLREIQDKYDIRRYFDVLSFSDEMGLRKPHPVIFEKTLEKLGLPPESVLHIGDNVIDDVKGAKGVGMRAVWYNTGTWPDAKTDEADAEINHFSELPPIARRL